MRKSLLVASVASAALMAAPPAFASTAQPIALAPISVTITPNYAVYREAHPEIRKAIAQLERAKRDLMSASHDFGGHRSDAVAACDNAISQLRLALQFDRE